MTRGAITYTLDDLAAAQKSLNLLSNQAVMARARLEGAVGAGRPEPELVAHREADLAAHNEHQRAINQVAAIQRSLQTQPR